jgi:hypothetical protein
VAVDVVVQVLVGVDRGGVGRQEEQLQLRVVLLPEPDGDGLVDRVVVDDQKDRAAGVMGDQLVAEVDEADLIAVALENVKQQRAVVADGADDVDREALARQRRDGARSPTGA